MITIMALLAGYTLVGRNRTENPSKSMQAERHNFLHIHLRHKLFTYTCSARGQESNGKSYQINASRAP
uniref:Secreted protein n=1 Tax=Globodera rostochiensis TaxID=31243 RepID=A0A914H4J3_GLORO